jgi:hypothetical protein
MSLEEIVTSWFKETWGGGLMLPDGWFGRPYDNIHRLDNVALSEDGLLLELDSGHLILRFEGVPEVTASKSELVLRSFRRLAFDWKEYGAMRIHSDKYEQGEVKFVAPPGA